MGWLFGWRTRKELVDHLVNKNGVKTIKHCFSGNNLWAVQEGVRSDGEKVVFACLYLIQGPAYGKDTGGPYAWGYKDVDESMGPCKTDFPASWLELLSPTKYPHALEWRAAVKARGEKEALMKIGTHWRLTNGKVYKIVRRRSPSSFIVQEEGGWEWRVTKKVLLKGEKVAGWNSESGTSTTEPGSAEAASTSHCTPAQTAV